MSSSSVLQARLEQRFGMLMQAGKCRVLPHELEFWEDQRKQVPWIVLNRLASCMDDVQAAGWLLASARTEDMVWVVLGFEKLRRQLRRDDLHAFEYAASALNSGFLAEAMRSFFCFWFDLPLDYWRSRQGYAAPQEFSI